MKAFVIHLSGGGPDTEERHRQAFLAQVLTVPYAPLHKAPGAARDAETDAATTAPSAPAHTTESTAALDEAEAAILAKAALEPGVFFMKIFSDLGLAPAAGKNAIDSLVGKGLVRIHAIPRAGRGAQYKTIEVTAAADSILRRGGIQRPPQRLKGSWLHDVFGRFIERWARKQGYPHLEFEKTIARKTFDLFATKPQGALGIEVCLSGSAPRTAEELAGALENVGLQVLAVFEQRIFMETTLKSLKTASVDDADMNRLSTKLIGEIIEEIE